MTTSRDAALATISNRSDVRFLVGEALLTSGLEAAFSKFLSLHDIPGVANWKTIEEAYRNSKADKTISLPYDAEKLAQVEAIIGYHFTNKKLLELALTAPAKNRRGPDYNRPEYLGDAIMEVVAIWAWIDQGSVADAATKTEHSACNRALQAVCLAAGLQKHIKRCEGKKPKIEAIAASYSKLKGSNKAYWIQGALCKTLVVVMESVYGAVFLDSGLRLLAVEGFVKKKTHTVSSSLCGILYHNT